MPATVSCGPPLALHRRGRARLQSGHELGGRAERGARRYDLLALLFRVGKRLHPLFGGQVRYVE